MRILNPRTHRAERGATIVIVALSMIALVGGGALAVDLGHSWTQRRGLVTATDAGALGAAEVYAKGGNGCSPTAGSLVSTNASDATMTGCDVTGTNKDGTVTVTAKRTVDYYLAPVIGKNSGTVTTATTARWGIPSSVQGLRPFGLCADSNAVIQAYVRNGILPTGDIQINYTKSNPLACGSNVPGNWGMIDFDGGSNSNSDTKSWVQDGYPGLVDAGTFFQTCTTEPTTCYAGDTGAFSNSLNSQLSSLVSSGESFALPVFDLAAGNGSNSQFHLVAFLFVKLVAFKATGSTSSRYLTVHVTTGVVQGTCCDPTGVDTGLRVVTICAIDASDKSGCTSHS